MLYPNGTTTRPTVSSPYGPRDPSIGVSGWHNGADLIGFATIQAVAAGLVTFAGWLNDAAGYTVVIDHGGGVSSIYMHNAAHHVRRGQRVTEGQRIARMGMTGNASGLCNHLEIRVHGKSTEPLGYIAKRLTNPKPATTPRDEEDMPTAEEIARAVWNYELRPWNEGKDVFGMPAEAAGSRLRRSADRAGRGLVHTRKIDRLIATVTGLQSAVTALATAQGADPDAILQAVTDGVETAMDGLTLTINAEDDDT